jgi:hypothetical protein
MLSMPKIDLSRPAAIIWLPEEEMPTVEAFGPESLSLEDAVDLSGREGEDGRLPWIKSEGAILSRSMIAQLRSGLRAMRMHDKKLN